MSTLKRFKVKLDDKVKVQELLQEIYNEACKNIEEAQREINKIEMSTNLNEESLDAKAKYAKAINDFIATKDKAIGRKLEIGKMMTEYLKYNGESQPMYNAGTVPPDWGELNLDDTPNNNDDNKKIEYKI